MRVAIRVDASEVIGTGHVRRCLALAHALREAGAAVRFVTRDLGCGAAAAIEGAGFAAIVLRKPDGLVAPSVVPHAAWAGIDGESDAAEAIAALADWSPAWVVVDHYAFDARWHRSIREALRCRIAIIDDLADRALDGDLIVDHNYAPDHRRKYEGWAAAQTEVLGGPRFALLGPAFATAARYEPQDPVHSVGVFMGGVDRDNVSAVVIDAIARAGFCGEVEIVSTHANPHLKQLLRKAEGRPSTQVVTDLPDLAAFFSRHGIQIGAGGGATWERCCVGAPTLLLVVAQNQLAVVPGLAGKNVIVTPDPVGTLDPDHIAQSLRRLLADAQLRSGLSARARALVDGLGARRVALRMLADEVRVRPAVRDDAETMHRWRNNEATRRVSRDPAEIGWEDHAVWLDRALDDPSKRLMIGMVGEAAIGVIRLDDLGGARAEVSLYIDPALHGLKLGPAMLRAAEDSVGDGLDILAEVMEGNPGSARMFESAGYVRIDPTHWIKTAAGRT